MTKSDENHQRLNQSRLEQHEKQQKIVNDPETRASAKEAARAKDQETKLNELKKEVGQLMQERAAQIQKANPSKTLADCFLEVQQGLDS